VLLVAFGCGVQLGRLPTRALPLRGPVVIVTSGGRDLALENQLSVEASIKEAAGGPGGAASCCMAAARLVPIPWWIGRHGGLAGQSSR